MSLVLVFLFFVVPAFAYIALAEYIMEQKHLPQVQLANTNRWMYAALYLLLPAAVIVRFLIVMIVNPRKAPSNLWKLLTGRFTLVERRG